MNEYRKKDFFETDERILSEKPWPFVEADLHLRKRISGMRERLPKIKRIPLKAKGPTYSIPERWATNPKPQIAAVRSSRISACRAFLFTAE